MRTGLFSSAQQRSFLFSIVVAMAAFTIPASAHQNWAEEMIAKAQKQAEAGVQRGSRVASLGGSTGSAEQRRSSRRASIAPEDRPQASRRGSSSSSSSRSSGGGSVSWVASASCLDGTLRNVIVNVASNYGPVRVNSTCRSAARNRAVGGAGRSYHLTGDAADFRVFGSVSAVYASLRSNGNVGGLKHYGGGLFHIDNGPRRSW